MKGRNILEAVRENLDKLDMSSITVEAVVLRRYVGGQALNFRVDDRNAEEEINLSNYTSALVVCEMHLSDLLWAVSLLCNAGLPKINEARRDHISHLVRD